MDSEKLAQYAERLRLQGLIDRALVAQQSPEEVAAQAIRPLRELLGVPRAIVNLFDLEKGEVEWLAAAGRERTRIGGGVRYGLAFMGDVEGLRRGEVQLLHTRELPPGKEVDALLASGVHVYHAVPMIAGGELIGALSFGGETLQLTPEKLEIAQQAAAQFAIAISQARMLERIRRHAEELEERVQQRTAALAAAHKELEAYSYSISHDLQAPLRAIDGFARILEAEHAGQLDAEGLRLLGVVRANAQKMGRLIEDLLQFARMGRDNLAGRKVDMTALVGRVCAALAADAPGVELAVGKLPVANGDEVLLEQVWVNLVGNAIKYSGRSAAPRVEIGGSLEFGGSASGGLASYWVRDNGVGFDMRDYSKLFGVCQRLHREDEFPGTGIGLAIVERVVARHGGKVWGEGKPGEGACFWFTLPVSA
jgi:signal transduction histidine kinase